VKGNQRRKAHQRPGNMLKWQYKRYLENKIRDNWDFSGVPIDIYIREKLFFIFI
jgi:predicted GTPase